MLQLITVVQLNIFITHAQAKNKHTPTHGVTHAKPKLCHSAVNVMGQ